MKREKVTIYTDGACSGNPGPGGWAAVCKLPDGKKKAVFGFEPKATNNKMELFAAIKGVLAVRKPCEILIKTDSQYLITCWSHSEKWLLCEERPNRELWLMLIKAEKDGNHVITFEKVNGHSGDEMNDLADEYAKAQIIKARHEAMR